MEDDDDFTFPTVFAAAREPAPAPPEGQLGGLGPVGHLLHPQLPVPELAAASPPLWPFAGSPKAPTAATPSSPAPVAADEEEEARVLGSSSGREDEQRAEAEVRGEEDEVRRAAADEERMDLLWEDATTTTTAVTIATATAPATQSTRSGAGHAEPKPNPKTKPNPRRAEADADDKRRAAAVADAERMDKLWESFNEDLLLLRQQHVRSKSAAAGHPTGGLDPADRWYLCNYPPSSDAESEEETTAASSPAERRGYGCAPTMLRASSRAGGASQFCGGGSSPRGGHGAAGGWALLLRLFRRLFAVDKAPATSSSRSHGSVYMP